MMRHNDIQAWEAFVTTVRTAGLSQAARSLGTTLSNHVRLLKELELSLDGGPLFARRQNPVELTPFGRRVFEVGTKLVDTHSTRPYQKRLQRCFGNRQVGNARPAFQSTPGCLC